MANDHWMPRWHRLNRRLHESIIVAEEGKSVEDIYLDDSYKTPAMKRWEKRFEQRIDIGLRTEPLICKKYPRLCTRITVSRCFFHRYGQIDTRLAKAWRVICMLATPNPKVTKVLRYFQDKRGEMDRIGVSRVPLVLTKKEVLVIIQALSLVPEDLEIEG